MDDQRDDAERSAGPPDHDSGDVTSAPDAEAGLEGEVGEAMGRLVPGAPVYDTTGERVGSVSAVNWRNDYFTMEKGVVFARDFYVPLSAVERMAPDAVHLNVDKDQMAYLGWDARPSDESLDDASSLSVEETDRPS